MLVKTNKQNSNVYRFFHDYQSFANIPLLIPITIMDEDLQEEKQQTVDGQSKTINEKGPPLLAMISSLTADTPKYKI